MGNAKNLATTLQTYLELKGPLMITADTATLDLAVMQEAAARACRLMKVLANPDRLLILCQLAEGEKRVGELEERLGILQPTLSQQLTVLRDEDLVSTRREGKNIYYALTSPKALAVMQVLYAQFCRPGFAGVMHTTATPN
jgi:DNA-binding transcriptional ArsR family regulator